MIQYRDNTATDLVRQLLAHDLGRFGNQLNLVEAPDPLPDATVARLLNLAERLSRSTDEDDRNTCLLITGLLWEHREPHWTAMPQFALNLLSRIGLAPSMRMVDPISAGDTRFGPVGSLIIEAAIEARNLEHEVTVAGRVPLVLSSFQKEVWDALDATPRLGISAPTSAGKSFVLVYKALDLLWAEEGAVLFVVPTISLIQQVTKDFRSAARVLGMTDLQVYQTYSGARTELDGRNVYVLTQERALAALSQPESLERLTVAVIDEVQNIERVAGEDEDRSRTMFDVIQELEGSRSPTRIVISGPRLENIAQLSRDLFGPDAGAVSQGLPPVVNLTYSFSRRRDGIHLRQHVATSGTPLEIQAEAGSGPDHNVFGKRQYRPAMYDFITDVVTRAAARHGTLVFSPTANQATRTAIALAERGQWPLDRALTDDLAEYVTETVHPSYALSVCLPSGVAFHHGKMPHHIRFAVEEAFAGLAIQVMTCTTTLMQGVNLPAKNIIARNPHLFINRGEDPATLTSYEFANLRGRAGRLLKDFVGRAIVLDEGAFEEQGLSFEMPTKQVAAGYGARFEANRQQIAEELIEGRPPSEEHRNADLVTYIRQAILRHGSDALRRLARTGVTITDKEFATTLRQLRQLIIPPDLCVRSPYWDPLVLDSVYRSVRTREVPELPRSPFVGGFVRSLIDVLQSLRSIAPYYYVKYFGEQQPKLVTSVAISAQRWAAGDDLKSIITWGERDANVDWGQIDTRLSRVQSQVAHDLPKLLRPLALMQTPENPIISALEIGAFRPHPRRLIEMGVPRETAIRVVRRFTGASAEMNDASLVRAAVRASSTLNYWEQVQIRDTLDPAIGIPTR